MNAEMLFEDTVLVPVVVIEDADSAVALAATLRDAGFGAIEVTLRTDCALQAIRTIAKDVNDILVGAGSLRRPGQVEEVVAAGAKFGVSPGAIPELLTAASRSALPIVPGAETASEVMRLLEAGYTLQKLFPAEASGGVDRLRSLSAPIPEVGFFPTGGINPANLAAYLSVPAVRCVGGSWFVPADLVAAGRFDEVGILATEAIQLARKV